MRHSFIFIPKVLLFILLKILLKVQPKILLLVQLKVLLKVQPEVLLLVQIKHNLNYN